MQRWSISDAVFILDSNLNELCAYIIAGSSLNISEIKNKLIKILPLNMVPTKMCQIQNFPMNSNGKIDKSKLPQINQETYKEAYIPKDDLEVHVLEKFREVFGNNKIGVYDDFFYLGGDSITGMILISKIKVLGVKLELCDIYNYSNVNELYKYIKKVKKKKIKNEETCFKDTKLLSENSYLTNKDIDLLNNFFK